MSSRIRLGINVDHVATLRNARGGSRPDPVRAALLAVEAGADGITAHLREDRRHIRDADMARLKAEIDKPLNFEMAATDDMVAIALKTQPHACCLVPEKREERTTEGGLDAAGQQGALKPVVHKLKHAGIRVSLFIGAQPKQIEAAAALGAPVIEIHTGAWCDALAEGDTAKAEAEWRLIVTGAELAARTTRNHRLWEQYLLAYADVAPGQVHRYADTIEHVLDAALVAELEQLLAGQARGLPQIGAKSQATRP